MALFYRATCPDRLRWMIPSSSQVNRSMVKKRRGWRITRYAYDIEDCLCLALLRAKQSFPWNLGRTKHGCK